MAVILFGFQTAIGNVQTLPQRFLWWQIGGNAGGVCGHGGQNGGRSADGAGTMAYVRWNYTPAFVVAPHSL